MTHMRTCMLFTCMIVVSGSQASVNRFNCAAYYNMLNKGLEMRAQKQSQNTSEQQAMPYRHAMRISGQHLKRCAQLDIKTLSPEKLQEELNACSAEQANLSVKGITAGQEDADVVMQYTSYTDRYLWYYLDILKVTPIALWRSIVG